MKKIYIYWLMLVALALPTVLFAKNISEEKYFGYWHTANAMGWATFDTYSKAIKVHSDKNMMHGGTFHLFTHGRSGELLIDGQWLDSRQIATWFKQQADVAKFKRIYIYGCEFGKGEKGDEAVTYLEQELGLFVSASDDITGKDGDWELEVGSKQKLHGFEQYEGNLQSFDDYSGTITLSGGIKAVNIPVELYADMNNNGVADAGDFVIDKTNTDSKGNYTLKNFATIVDNFSSSGTTKSSGTLPWESSAWKSGGTVTYGANIGATGNGFLNNAKIVRISGGGASYITRYVDLRNFRTAGLTFLFDRNGASPAQTAGDSLRLYADVGSTRYSLGGIEGTVGGSGGPNLTVRLYRSIIAPKVDSVNIVFHSVASASNELWFIDEVTIFGRLNNLVIKPLIGGAVSTTAPMEIDPTTAGSNDFTIAAIDQNDTDADGIADFKDQDDDNDGLTDIQECSRALDYADWSAWSAGALTGTAKLTAIGNVSVNTATKYWEDSVAVVYNPVGTEEGLGFNTPIAASAPEMAAFHPRPEFTSFFNGGTVGGNDKLRVWTGNNAIANVVHGLEFDFTASTLGHADERTVVGLGHVYPDVLNENRNVIRFTGIKCDGTPETNYSNWNLMQPTEPYTGSEDVAGAGTTFYEHPFTKTFSGLNGFDVFPSQFSPPRDGNKDQNPFLVILPTGSCYNKIGIERILYASGGIINATVTPPSAAVDFEHMGVYLAEISSCDSDGDNVADSRDFDSDNDGIPDAIEACPGTTLADLNNCSKALNTTEVDTSGNPTGVTVLPCSSATETDLDVLPDYLDTDADNDGCSDAKEAGTEPTNAATADARGMVNSCQAPSTTAWIDTNATSACSLSVVAYNTDPDVNGTFVGMPISGDLSTNDDVPAGSTYKSPMAVSGNPDGSMPVIDSTGAYTFTSSVPGVYKFDVLVCPTKDVSSCFTELLTITVQSDTADNPPVANTDLATTTSDTPVTLNTLANDAPGINGAALDPAKVTIVDSTKNGTLSVNPSTGEITYTPNSGFVGSDTLRYQVCDSGTPEQCTQAFQIITVEENGTNVTSASDDYAQTPFNTPVSGSILANDIDANGNTQTVTALNDTIPGVGILSVDMSGNFTFTPAPNFSGPVNRPYQVCDNGTPAACDSATLYLLVAPNPCDNYASGADVCAAITAGSAGLDTIDCDGDGVTNGAECTPPGGGTSTDSKNPCDFNAADITLPVTADTSNCLCPDITKMAPTCDFDGDGVINSDDLDDDNDGILDNVECVGTLVTPTAVTASTTCCGTTATTTINATEAAFADGVQLTDVLPNPFDLLQQGFHYPKDLLDTNTYTFAFGSNELSGVVIWTPGMNTSTFKHDDGPVRQFTITLKHSGGAYTSPIYTTVISGAAQVFSFDKIYTGVTEVKMKELNGWVDPLPDDNVHFPTGSSSAPDKVAQSLDYNMYLHEFRGVFASCDTDGDGIVNQFDLDSDGDGCGDAIEGAGTFDSGDVVASTLPGGNSGAGYTGKSKNPVNENLGDTVDVNGVPTKANGGQGLGESQVSGPDADGDGIPAQCDPSDTDPCQNTYTTRQAFCDAITAGAAGLNTTDCDGDGVTNGAECTPPGGGTPTNPTDPCSSNSGDITNPVTADMTNCPCTDTTKMAANCDYDGDGKKNSDDLDDDNDGILDNVECVGTLVTPTAAAASTTCCGTTATTTINATEAAFADGVQLTDVLPNPFDLLQQGFHYPENLLDTNTYTFAFGSNALSGVVIWTPGMNTSTFKHDDGPVRQFTITLKHSGGTYTSPVYTTVISGAAQVFSFDKIYTGVTEVKMKELNGWVDPLPDDNVHFPTGSSSAPDKVAQSLDYNMYLHEFRGVFASCDTDGDGIVNQFDLDSDGDGCSDAIEGAGTFDSGDVVASTLPGGNSGAGYTGKSKNPVNENLGDTVDVNGVPTKANGGQGLGDSQVSGPDADGDGIPAQCDPSDTDPCQNTYTTDSAFCAAVGSGGAAGLDTADCDGDGQKNGIECSNSTDPNDPCSNTYADGTAMCAAITGGAAGLDTVDCDGDGVANKKECTDGTDPQDPCDYVTASQTLTPSAGFDSLDCDGDGIPNVVEDTSGTDPNDPCSNTYADGAAMCAAITAGAAGLDTVDCDGDGVANKQECTDGTDPQDPCDYVTASQTLTPSGGFDSLDCDGDGIPNVVEDTSGTDPNDPCSNTYADGTAMCAAITAGAAGLDTVDCDGDGVANKQECTDGTDPQDPCDYVTASQTLTPSGGFDSLDCDGDGIPNVVEDTSGTDPNDPCSNTYADGTAMCAAITSGSAGLDTVDCDGDGVANEKECTDGTDPQDPCDYVTASQTLTPSGGFDSLDCDGDGIPNVVEDTSGTDPNDPCSNTYADGTAMCAAITAGAAGLDTVDCDGDGVANKKECADGTDPKDPCDYVTASQTLTPSAGFDSLDCDGDGIPNIVEDTSGTDPNDPCSNTYADGTAMCAAITSGAAGLDTVDCDGDGVANKKECTDGTDPQDPCDYAITSQTISPKAAFGTLDCDGDGIPNIVEDTSGTDPNDPCSNTYADGTAMCAAITSGAAGLDTVDCDGDGVANEKECTDGTDPQDPCDYVTASQTLTPSAGFDSLDCDGDGIPNVVEDTSGTDPNDPCSNTYADGAAMCAAITAGAAGLDTVDCDGDGVANKQECTDGTDPQDPCDYVTASQTLTPSGGFDSLDCDGDGIPNVVEDTSGTDPNDPCSNTYADGTAMCAAITAGAAGLDTVDCDGDGVANKQECTDGTDPQDPCDYVTASQTLTPSGGFDSLDCDGDGIPNVVEDTSGTDPNDPCSNTYADGTAMCAAITSGSAGLDTVDCDGDGVANEKECTDGTDPQDPCDYVTASQTLTPSGGFDSLDCDGDGIPNVVEDTSGTDPNDPCSNTYADGTAMCAAITAGAAGLDTVDCDGDGVANKKECTDGTDPKDPCDYVTASQTLTPSAGFDSLDCDGDGIPNVVEDTSGTDPNDPCSNTYADGTAMCAAITSGAAGLDTVDCDGDGVANKKECTDGTDPQDPCDYAITSQTISPKAAFGTLDCDGDGIPNIVEDTSGTDPNDPCSNTYADGTAMCAAITSGAAGLDTVDCDGDGVANEKECTDGTDPQDPCDYVTASQTLTPSAGFDSLDCDGDGIPNVVEDTSGTDPNDPCSNTYASGTEMCVAITGGAAGLDTVDCDGDGVANKKECTDGTDPQDPCDYVTASQTLTPSGGFDSLDCDGDGIPNIVEDTSGTDPNDPCSNTYADGTAMCAAITAGAAGLDTVDCDGDGVANKKECTDGTDPQDPCDYVTASQTLTPSGGFDSLDCDGDGIPNVVEDTSGTNPKDPCSNTYADGAAMCAAITAGAAGLDTVDCDGDGVANKQECTDGTDPQDPCDYVTASQTLTPSGGFDSLDCDGDGIPNVVEDTSGTDPNDPCSNTYADGTAMCAAITSGSAGLDTVDCDGDGVANEKECTDGTDPQDPCNYVTASQTLTPSGGFDSLDCDGDGIPNVVEDTSGTDPNDPCSNTYADGTAMCAAITAGAAGLDTVDCDGDGVANKKECTDGTDPQDPCDYVTASQTLTPSGGFDSLDCDGDGIPNVVEDTSGTNPKDPCSNTYADGTAMCAAITAGAAGLDTVDCDGDGVANKKECTDGTDPQDPCDYVTASQTLTPSAGFDSLDCDGDGIPNVVEDTSGTDPNDPCSNTYADGTAMCAAITAGAAGLDTVDCDGDGVANKKECTDGTDPQDPCDYVTASITLPVTADQSICLCEVQDSTEDCDKDGVINKDDPDPKNPCVNGYTKAAEVCSAMTGGASGLNAKDCDGDGVSNIDECVPPGGGTPTDPLNPCSRDTSDITMTVVADTAACEDADNGVLALRVLLQGALFPTESSGAMITTGIMRDDLRSAGVIPKQEPYTSLSGPRFQHVLGGGDSLGTGVLSVIGDNAIVDWVFVELRDSLDLSKVVETRSALVQRDGDVIDPDKTGGLLVFEGKSGKGYYVSVKHRNHLGVMTARPVVLSADTTLVDFRTLPSEEVWNASPGYEGYERVKVSNLWALWGGNTNAESKVKYIGPDNDQSRVFTYALGYPTNTTSQYNFDFAKPVYELSNVNMDGKSKYRGPFNDTRYIFFNVISEYTGKNTSLLYNYDLFVEQIP